jgi:hypothetical protein
MKEFKVIIPQENYTIVEFKQDNLPAVMVLNSSLIKFEPKEVFSWNLSIILEFNELGDNGMPIKNEVDLIEPFEKSLDDNLKGNKERPNALFLARITWNGTRQLLYRVNDPEITNIYLQGLINNKKYPREFDYRMESDEEWELNKWYLDTLKNNIQD